MDKYQYTEISGKVFNELNKNKLLYKFTNKNEIHYNYKYNDGLNVDIIPFNPSGACSGGGLYFVDEDYVYEFLENSLMGGYAQCIYTWFRYVTIPDDARIYVEHNKFKADKFILSCKFPIFTVKENDPSSVTCNLPISCKEIDTIEILIHYELMVNIHFPKIYANLKHKHFISKYQNFNKTFIKKFQDRINWDVISYTPLLSKVFIENFPDRVDWDDISFTSLNEEFVEQFQDMINWRLLSANPLASDLYSYEFFYKFKYRINWMLISSNSKLKIEFVEIFQDKLNWNKISYNPYSTEELLEHFQDKINWNIVSQYQALSKKFIEKFQNRLNLKLLSYNLLLNEKK